MSYSVVLKNDFLSLDNFLLEKETQITGTNYEISGECKIYDMKNLEEYDTN